MKKNWPADTQLTIDNLENWSKTKTRPHEWYNTLDLDSQENLEQFAKFQRFVMKAFKILLPLTSENQEKTLNKGGSVKLAQRWLIWSNTCVKYNFLP